VANVLVWADIPVVDMARACRFYSELLQVEVTDAQVALFTARVNAARASIDYYLAVAELARARGHDVPLPPTRAASR
jgi:predicted enzyme related to lactoylglutathione lyase